MYTAHLMVLHQGDRLSSSNKELRRKLRQSQNQLHCLVDERAELQVLHWDGRLGVDGIPVHVLVGSLVLQCPRDQVWNRG